MSSENSQKGRKNAQKYYMVAIYLIYTSRAFIVYRFYKKSEIFDQNLHILAKSQIWSQNWVLFFDKKCKFLLSFFDQQLSRNAPVDVQRGTKCPYDLLNQPPPIDRVLIFMPVCILDTVYRRRCEKEVDLGLFRAKSHQVV